MYVQHSVSFCRRTNHPPHCLPRTPSSARASPRTAPPDSTPQTKTCNITHPGVPSKTHGRPLGRLKDSHMTPLGIKVPIACPLGHLCTMSMDTGTMGEGHQGPRIGDHMTNLTPRDRIAITKYSRMISPVPLANSKMN